MMWLLFHRWFNYTPPGALEGKLVADVFWIGLYVWCSTFVDWYCARRDW